MQPISDYLADYLIHMLETRRASFLTGAQQAKNKDSRKQFRDRAQECENAIAGLNSPDGIVRASELSQLTA